MSQPIDALYHALGYLYDLTFGEVCEPEDHAHHLAKARGIAVAALAQAGPLVHHRQAETHVERVRREKREAGERTQIRLPVKEHLRQRRDATRARVVAGLAAIDAWETAPADRRRLQAKTFLSLAAQLADLADQVAAPLPDTTIVACPHCNRTTLPGWHGVHECCSTWWGVDPRRGDRPLPAGFWTKRLPGDPSGLRKADDMEDAA